MKNHANLIFFIFLFITACSDPASEPATTGSISGSIINAFDGKNIALAKIVTTPPSGSVTSDDKGIYEIENVDPGVYRVLAAKVGYDTNSVLITVSAGNKTVADVHLLPDSLADSLEFAVPEFNPSLFSKK